MTEIVSISEARDYLLNQMWDWVSGSPACKPQDLQALNIAIQVMTDVLHADVKKYMDVST